MEIFRRKLNGWSASSEGYEVQVVSRSHVSYRDRFGTLVWAAEDLSVAPFGMVVFLDDIADEPGRTGREVLERIGRAFAHKGEFVDFAPDPERVGAFAIAPWLTEPVEFSDVHSWANMYEQSRSWSASLDPDMRAARLDKLWSGVCEWAEIVGARRVIVESPFPQTRAWGDLGFTRRRSLWFPWLEWKSATAEVTARTILEQLPRYGDLRLTFSKGHEVLGLVSGDWRIISIHPPSGVANEHFAYFRSLLEGLDKS
ncbi:MAG: hypothetical protein RLZZ608_354 [Actinomycetota bacterium]